ncbi:hypothetical protein NQ317_016371 [Molorchus minor]|uniref:GPI inositol-deacylase n=1 Tax=Molorchus minor TaxID=1323400 RepID=A0ABQ9JC21_9CUCU|nr:hypothetical protein NQ317_016371 [Molorchus minor]
MIPVNGFIFTCLVIVFAYGIGLLHFLNGSTEDKCEMTYMFEYPQFVRISNEADKQFPKYGLYSYSEGKFTAKARRMYFDGIPVLFIPGNKGSYKQVRSLSSVALRKALNSRTPFHFDYYTIDFNDELSGLYGPLLYDQLSYLNSSLYRILELYNERKNKPTSIALIGHSMGGIVAKNLLSQLSNPNLVSLLITLATPLKRAPFIWDSHMHDFYENKVWKIDESVNTTVISVSGGYNDFLIPSYLTEIQDNNSLSAVTTNIPRCWVEANHKQVIWCKQLVLAINRAIFDSVDLNTRQISSNSTYRRMVFYHHIVHHGGINIQNRDRYFKSITIGYGGQWIESLLRQYSIELMKGVREPHWYMVRLTMLPAHETLSLLAINLESTDWVFACNANYPRGGSRVCTEASHMTHMSKIWPSVKYKRRYFELNMNEFHKNNSEHTHIVFRTLPTNEPVVFHVDVYNSAERKITVNLPKWWSLMKHDILEQTADKALSYELILPQLQHIIQYYVLYVESINCDTENHHASASLIAPWSNQNQHSYFTNTNKTPLSVRLYSSRPRNAESAFIKLTLDPSCRYRISLKSSITGMLGQMSRFYTPLLLTNIAAVVLMSLKFQLSCLKNGYCSMFFVAIKEGAKPYYVLTIAKLLSKVVGELKSLKFLPKPDVIYLVEEGSDFFLLPLLSYMCGAGIVWFLAIIFCVSLVTLESTVHKMALKFLARTVSFNIAWSDYLMSALHKIPFVVAAGLVIICFSTCGGLAICLGGIFYFLKLTQMSQDYIEEVVWFFIKKIAKRCKTFFGKKKSRGSQEQTSETEHGIDGNSKNITETITDEETQEEGKVVNINKKHEGSNESEKELVEEASGDSKMHDTKTSLNQSEDERVDNIVDDSIKTEETKVHKRKNKRSKKIKEGNSIVKDNTPSEKQDATDIDKKNCKSENVTNEEKIHNTKEEKPIEENELSSSYNSIFFHSTLFFIWFLIAIINVPAVLTWAHNFKFNTNLSPDDSFVPGLALSLCAFPLWQFNFPKTDRKWINVIEKFVMTAAVLSLMFATVSVYRLNYFLTFTIVVITLHQMLAPKIDPRGGEDDNVDDETRVKYEDMKTKLE